MGTNRSSHPSPQRDTDRSPDGKQSTRTISPRFAMERPVLPICMPNSQYKHTGQLNRILWKLVWVSNHQAISFFFVTLNRFVILNHQCMVHVELSYIPKHLRSEVPGPLRVVHRGGFRAAMAEMSRASHFGFVRTCMQLHHPNVVSNKTVVC